MVATLRNGPGKLARFLTRRSVLTYIATVIATAILTLFFAGHIKALRACGFDWTVFWIALQAVAIIAAAVVAVGQLASYLSTEQAKNTIALFQELDTGEISDTINRLTSWEDARENVDQACFLLETTGGATKEATLLQMLNLSNMFDRVALQFDTDIISRGIYLRRMDEVTLICYAVLARISELAESSNDRGPYDLSEFKNLARECKRHYLKRPHISPDSYLAALEI